MEPGVLLDMAELLEAALAVRTLVRFLAGVHAYVLDQLMVGAERLEALLTLVRFAYLQAATAQRTAADAAGSAEVAGLHLHSGRLLHEYLETNETATGPVSWTDMRREQRQRQRKSGRADAAAAAAAIDAVRLAERSRTTAQSARRVYNRTRGTGDGAAVVPGNRFP